MPRAVRDLYTDFGHEVGPECHRSADNQFSDVDFEHVVFTPP